MAAASGIDARPSAETMADTEMSELSSLSDPGSESSSSDDSDSEKTSKSKAPAEKIEWLATGRARRTTAGNRMKSLLASMGASAGGVAAGDGGGGNDSDLELLFAEDEDDDGWSLDEKDKGGGDDEDDDEDDDDDDDGSRTGGGVVRGNDDDDGSDMHMDSSGDDEDDEDDGGGSGGGGADNLAGERELERRERERKLAARKRRAQAAIPARFRKKVRIAGGGDQTTTVATTTPTTTTPTESAAAARRRKKSERTSWLPSVTDAPTRSSARATTRISKEQLHQQMAERERRRVRQLAVMAKKQQRAEANRKPPLTQAQRLAAAAVVEQTNTRSLNTWEEAEKLREADRAAKLAAMYNRTLEGPVVTFWSGIVELALGAAGTGDGGGSSGQDGHSGQNSLLLRHAGRMVSIEEKAPRKKRQTAAAKEAAAREAAEAKAEAEKAEMAEKVAEEEASKTKTAETTTEHPDKTAALQDESRDSKGESAEADQPVKDGKPPETLSETLPETTEPAQPTRLDAEYSQAVFMPIDMPTPPEATADTPMSDAVPPVQPMSSQDPSSDAQRLPAAEKPMPVPEPLAVPLVPDGAQPVVLPSPSQAAPSLSEADTKPDVQATAQATMPPPPVPPASSPAKEPMTPSADKDQVQPPPDQQDGASAAAADIDGRITRTCIVLQNFDEDALKDRQVQMQVLFGRRMAKIGKPAQAPLCSITGHPARYRDVQTGLPFYNSYAYKEIRKLVRGDYRWSRLVGAWAGPGVACAAAGVPDGFLDASKVKKKGLNGDQASRTVGDETGGKTDDKPDGKTDQAKTDVPETTDKTDKTDRSAEAPQPKQEVQDAAAPTSTGADPAPATTAQTDGALSVLDAM